ncbi:MAG: alpha/beta hydrolase-fold protein [Comamonadaceae bacterium]|nr:alpha/beta hydrolase-fold protein [Comamonadaceae bacterium]
MESWVVSSSKTPSSRNSAIAPGQSRIMLPDGYDDHPEKRYPVLYMHDGQNLFDPSGYSGYSRDVARTLDKMQAAGETDGIIVVGIDNGGDHRICEYSQTIGTRAAKRIEKNFKGMLLADEGGRVWRLGRRNAQAVDRRPLSDPARTSPTTGIAGSSCGANISLSVVLAHPRTFGVVGVFSPALWVIAPDVFRRLETSGSLRRAGLPRHGRQGRKGSARIACARAFVASSGWRAQAPSARHVRPCAGSIRSHAIPNCSGKIDSPDSSVGDSARKSTSHDQGATK